jgi:hypothetical protein
MKKMELKKIVKDTVKKHLKEVVTGSRKQYEANFDNSLILKGVDKIGSPDIIELLVTTPSEEVSNLPLKVTVEKDVDGFGKLKIIVKIC